MTFGKYPDCVIIDDVSVPVDTDFRIMIRFENAVQKSENAEISAALSDFFIGNIPSDINAAVNAAVKFYLCGKNPDENTANNPKNKKRCYDYDEDSRYFIAAFNQQYGIDLESANLHWWKFSALFAGLTDATRLINIMQIRSTDTSKITDKNERERIRKLQRQYALKEYRKRRYNSCAERDKAMIEAAKKRLSELERKE